MTIFLLRSSTNGEIIIRRFLEPFARNGLKLNAMTQKKKYIRLNSMKEKKKQRRNEGSKRVMTKRKKI
jgi:hypothetical protein